MITRTSALALTLLAAASLQPAFAEGDATEQFNTLNQPAQSLRRHSRQFNERQYYIEKERAEREAARYFREQQRRLELQQRRYRRDWDD